MRSRTRICYLQVRERDGDVPPRPAACSDLELLAMILGEGEEALGQAERLLDGGSAALLKRLTRRRIRTVAGERAAEKLLASLELGRRALQGDGRCVLSSPKHVQSYARAYAAAEKEHFLVVHLSTRHMPSLLEVVSVGTLNSSLVHPREVFRRAIREGTACLVLVHNHPSGDPAPSADDIEITSRLVKVGELVGIEVIDHVILAGERYFSFREEGLF